MTNQLVGHSLSRCVLDILEGRVKEEDVEVIITRTRFNFYDPDHWEAIWTGYTRRNPFSNNVWVNFSEEQERVRGLVGRLWDDGKIHQPRNFGAYPLRVRNIWSELVQCPAQ